MKIVLQNVLLWLVSIVAYRNLCLASQDVTIGVLLSEENHQFEVALNSTLHQKNADILKAFFKSNVKNISKDDSFEASKTLCGMLEAGNGVAAVISFESLTSAVQESICDHFEVPYIMTSWKPSTTRRTNTIVNFFPEDQLYAQALAEVVKSLRWSSVGILYENEEGLLRMRGILELQDFKHGSEKNNILVKQLGAGNDHRSLLKEIKNDWGNNIILDCKTESIIPFLKQAKDKNLLDSRNNYLLTSLDAHTLNYEELDTAANITTIRLFDYNREDFKDIIKGSKDAIEMNQIKTETVLFYDALQYITESITHHYYTVKNIKTNSISCHEKIMSEYGYAFASYMKEIKFSSTLSGPIKFDDNGNRIDFNIQVVDILEDRIIADWFSSNQSLLLRRSPIERQFLGNKSIVIVSSRLGEPYLMKKVPEEGKTLYGNDRYEGYSLDLITEIAKLIGFKFEFRLTADGHYGQWNERNKKWSGLIGDILEERADLAVCDLTITHQRREVVDFSMPFMTLGISILYTKAEIDDGNWFSFLNPFSISVWIYTGALYLIVSVVLYFISRITPGNWENPHPSDDHPEELENIWDMKNCLWLTLASVMTQGCDILPKGTSSRIAVTMWWFFSLILVSSYIANLTVFLSIDRTEPVIDGAEALAGQSKVKYGVVNGGSTMAFFRDSNFSTYQRMWVNMDSSKPSVFESNNLAGMRRVQTSQGKYAFIMESTQIEYVTQTNCDLKQVGTFLDTKSYGIAMPMNAPYRSAINKAILKLHETGRLNDLKNRWWKEKREEPACENFDTQEESNGGQLTLADTSSVFYLLGVGVVIAIILATIEFLWNVRNVSAEEHITYGEALKMELKFACNVWITKKRTKQESLSPPLSAVQEKQ